MAGADTDILFLMFETQRLLRLYAERQVRPHGLTRIQWGVLTKVERTPGMKQSELAELMDLQPITLTRMVDRLCDQGLVERRSDETDRRVNRLYPTAAAVPLLETLHVLRQELTQTALSNFSAQDIDIMARQLNAAKDNLREALNSSTPPLDSRELAHG